MFQFRRFPSYTYLIQCTLHGYCPCGLPHSEISGSMDICSSPKVIAACHVLRRLLMPRHSPCALYSLTYSRYFGSRSVLNYAGNHRFTFSQNCNCYPLLLQKCSTIKISQLSSRSSLKDLSVALLFITFNTLFSFQGAMFRFLLKPDVNVQSLERFHLFSKAYRLLLSGGDSRDRTGDLLLARQALSQLSYIPIVESSSVSLAAALALRLARSAASPLLAQTLRWFALGT